MTPYLISVKKIESSFCRQFGDIKEEQQAKRAASKENRLEQLEVAETSRLALRQTAIKLLGEDCNISYEDDESAKAWTGEDLNSENPWFLYMSLEY